MKTHRQTEPCKNCPLPWSCFTVDVNFAEHTSEIAQVVQEETELKKGELLYHQGDQFRGLFTVKSGGLKTFLINAAGDQVITGFYLPGEILGFDAVHSEYLIENAEALISTKVCRIPFQSLLALANKHERIQHDLFKLFSQRIHTMRQSFHLNAEQKVATFLLDYARRLQRQKEDGVSFQLLPTQQDIASYLDLTPETVSRTFHKFVSMKVYESSRVKQIEALDVQKLQRIIERIGE